jgi:hypothetical protein
VLGGVRDVALIHYPSCTDSIKPSLQFLCYFVVNNASEGSLCFQNFELEIIQTTFMTNLQNIWTKTVASACLRGFSIFGLYNLLFDPR